jgi:hypothetical protein
MVVARFNGAPFAAFVAKARPSHGMPCISVKNDFVYCRDTGNAEVSA